MSYGEYYERPGTRKRIHISSFNEIKMNSKGRISFCYTTNEREYPPRRREIALGNGRKREKTFCKLAPYSMNPLS